MDEWMYGGIEYVWVYEVMNNGIIEVTYGSVEVWMNGGMDICRYGHIDA